MDTASDTPRDTISLFLWFLQFFCLYAAKVPERSVQWWIVDV